MQTDFKKQIIAAIILLVLTVFSVFLLITFLPSRIDKEKSPDLDPTFTKEEISKVVDETQNPDSNLEEFLSYKKFNIYLDGLVTPENLVSSCQDGEKNGQSCNKEIASITRKVRVEGKIEEAYLYMRVAVSRDNGPLGKLTDFDSIWFFIDDAKNYGGHLLRSKALVNRQQEDGTQELLFNLEEIPFTTLPYNEKADPNYKNLLEVLNNGETEHYVASFVSTLGYGKVIEMQIGYKGGLIQGN